MMSRERQRSFSEGEQVRIKAGPFSGFTGVVLFVQPDTETMQLTINLLGKLPLVEVVYDEKDVRIFL